MVRATHRDSKQEARCILVGCVDVDGAKTEVEFHLRHVPHVPGEGGPVELILQRGHRGVEHVVRLCRDGGGGGGGGTVSSSCSINKLGWIHRRNLNRQLLKITQCKVYTLYTYPTTIPTCTYIRTTLESCEVT